MPTIAKLLTLEGDCHADVGWWSGSFAKEDGLVFKDRVAGVSRLCFQTNTHQNLQLCRSMRLGVFLSEKRAKLLLRRYQPPPYHWRLGYPFP